MNIKLNNFALVFVLLCSAHLTSAQEEGDGSPGGGGTGDFAPDGMFYTNTCTYQNQNGTYWDVWFNDLDGDCISNDWYVIYYNPNGTISDQKTDEDWTSSGQNSTINFGAFLCCGGPNGGGGQEVACAWEFNESTNTLEVSCETGEHD